MGSTLSFGHSHETTIPGSDPEHAQLFVGFGRENGNFGTRTRSYLPRRLPTALWQRGRETVIDISTGPGTIPPCANFYVFGSREFGLGAAGKTDLGNF